ncbi:MAG: hypothetical protein KKD46_07700 [Euryarchaeota archaeon]|nr:hypothetical protein [Euryarchaeota archaeon]MBU4340783.1 hypothetical protein [Euryarchaeota archaeon]MCG2737167.1 hypothetical protein [Candidatus Methanoperedenaceae archaeon]
MKENTCDKAIEILQATSDGDKLASIDLSLVEGAINGFLTTEGIKAFNKLHKTVAAGEYKQPWFHGIENMTIDNVGFIYWKGAIVEHYEQPWAYSKVAKESAQELKRRCEILESKGIPLNITTVIWRWVEGE